MKHLILARHPSKEWGTLGRLYDKDSAFPICDTLELPWLGNKRRVSCIPPGIYQVVYKNSNKWNRKVYWLKDVPGRSAIQIHIGNIAPQIQGCILPGKFAHQLAIRVDGKLYSQPGVADSGKHLDMLAGYCGDKFTLEIINAFKE
jgi:hypothetical protein